MCKAQDEGGQRCAAHAKKGIESAQRRFDSSGSEDDLQGLVSAYVQYASTSEGFDAMSEKIRNGEEGPGDLPATMWERIQHDGLELRRRNTEIARAVREAAAKGEAFHADVKEKWGSPFGYVPPGVRGPKSLEKFLANEQKKMRWAATVFPEDLETAARVDAALKEVEAASITPDAGFEDRLPRSEEEKAAWVRKLTQERDRNATMGNARLEGVIEHNERMARFGKPGYETDPAKIVPPLDAPGTLVRLRNEDGTVSEREYLVYRVVDEDRDADGATTVGLMPLVATENAPSDYNLRELQPEVSFRGEVAWKEGGKHITADRLAPASETTVATYGKRLEITEDRYTTEIAPGMHANTVRAWTIGGYEMAKFDAFRAEWARKNAPYREPKADTGPTPTIGKRLKGLFAG